MRLTSGKQIQRQHSSTLFGVLLLAVFGDAVLGQSPTFFRTDYAGLGNNHIAADFNGTANLMSQASAPKPP
jgi:hypothetical protein